MPTVTEWILIVIVLVLVFGASRLGDLGNAIGRALHRSHAPEDDDEDRA